MAKIDQPTWWKSIHCNLRVPCLRYSIERSASKICMWFYYLACYKWTFFNPVLILVRWKDLPLYSSQTLHDVWKLEICEPSIFESFFWQLWYHPWLAFVCNLRMMSSSWLRMTWKSMGKAFCFGSSIWMTCSPSQKISVRSGIRTHASKGRPERPYRMSSQQCRGIEPWVWRLRPLGHPDGSGGDLRRFFFSGPWLYLLSREST